MCKKCQIQNGCLLREACDSPEKHAILAQILKLMRFSDIQILWNQVWHSLHRSKVYIRNQHNSQAQTLFILLKVWWKVKTLKVKFKTIFMLHFKFINLHAMWPFRIALHFNPIFIQTLVRFPKSFHPKWVLFQGKNQIHNKCWRKMTLYIIFLNQQVKQVQVLN